METLQQQPKKPQNRKHIRVRQMGHSLGLTIPQKFVEALRLAPGTDLNLELCDDDSLRIVPIPPTCYNIGGLLPKTRAA